MIYIYAGVLGCGCGGGHVCVYKIVKVSKVRHIQHRSHPSVHLSIPSAGRRPSQLSKKGPQTKQNSPKERKKKEIWNISRIESEATQWH